jgi:DNA-binding CsgD family transcriptional regulator
VSASVPASEDVLAGVAPGLWSFRLLRGGFSRRRPSGGCLPLRARCAMVCAMARGEHRRALPTGPNMAGEGRPWPKHPPDLELTMVCVGDVELAVLSHPLDTPASLEGLTPAERAIASAIAEGLSNREIGRLRKTSERTVAKQVAEIFRKAGVGSRRELLARLRTQDRR